MKLFFLLSAVVFLFPWSLSSSELVSSHSQKLEIVSDPVIPEPITGTGRLDISVETFTGRNPKRITQIAHRVEIWLGQRRLASLNRGDQGVVEEGDRRIFAFSGISLPVGYYFIGIRAYGSAVFHGRDKWHEEKVQVGIHPDRTSRVYKKIRFFHW